jgi:hypothetical protein
MTITPSAKPATNQMTAGPMNFPLAPSVDTCVAV